MDWNMDDDAVVNKSHPHVLWRNPLASLRLSTDRIDGAAITETFSPGGRSPWLSCVEIHNILAALQFCSHEKISRLSWHREFPYSLELKPSLLTSILQLRRVFVVLAL